MAARIQVATGANQQLETSASTTTTDDASTKIKKVEQWKEFNESYRWVGKVIALFLLIWVLSQIQSGALDTQSKFFSVTIASVFIAASMLWAKQEETMMLKWFALGLITVYLIMAVIGVDFQDVRNWAKGLFKPSPVEVAVKQQASIRHSIMRLQSGWRTVTVGSRPKKIDTVFRDCTFYYQSPNSFRIRGGQGDMYMRKKCEIGEVRSFCIYNVEHGGEELYVVNALACDASGRTSNASRFCDFPLQYRIDYH